MNLIIVESPTKARTLSKFLGSEYSVEATMGHIKDLPKSKLGIDVEHNFKPDYIPVEKKADVIKKITHEASKADKTYIATDPDREGEAIAQHVKEIVGAKNSKRITFHEITKEAVEEAIANPRDVDDNLVDAQIARRVLDRLVGYSLSPLLWKKVRRGLSAGRVQSVAVRLIVEREREIEKFKPQEYWEIYCKVTGGKEFTIALIKIDGKAVEIKNSKEAEKVVSDLKNANYTVSDVRRREVRKNPFPPFTTSTMTQAGARLFGWSAKKTMREAQGLYEEGLITYHRTDSTNIATVAVSKARDFIKSEYGDKYLPDSPRFYKTTSKVAQEAHEAIRPTDMTKKPNGVSKLYDLIWRRFMACQMTPAVYDEVTIDVKADKYLLRAGGQTMKFDGWRKVIPAKLTEESVVMLPDVSKDEKLKLIKVEDIQKFTEPPARYNEASIIKTLEKLGIGRPSTYAPIITTIQIRQYVEKKDGKFFATPVGIAVTDFLVTNFEDIVDYKFTAEMENDLDMVANGERKWEVEMKKFWGPFDKKTQDITKNAKRIAIPTEKLGQKCPDCVDGELVIRIGRFGKFVSCSNFPECKHTEKYLEKIGIKCLECKTGEIIIKKTGKGRNFFGCSNYPECTWASWKKPGKDGVVDEKDKKIMKPRKRRNGSK